MDGSECRNVSAEGMDNSKQLDTMLEETGVSKVHSRHGWYRAELVIQPVLNLPSTSHSEGEEYRAGIFACRLQPFKSAHRGITAGS